MHGMQMSGAASETAAAFFSALINLRTATIHDKTVRVPKWLPREHFVCLTSRSRCFLLLSKRRMRQESLKRGHLKRRDVLAPATYMHTQMENGLKK